MSTDDQLIEECHKLSIEIARKAGAMVARAFKQPPGRFDKKSLTDPVTETDRAVERFIRESIRARYPEHQFIGEESAPSASLSGAPTWIVDPIDGTANFVHRIPFCAVCIAFALGRTVVSGVVYNPIADQLYEATINSPARLNGAPIAVSATAALSDAAIATEVGSGREPAKLAHVLDNLRIVLENNAQCLRMQGSCALSLCMVAAGQLDLFYEWGPLMWDFGAATVIVRQAGGVVLDPSGAPHELTGRAVFASNPALAKSLQLQSPIAK